MNRYQPLPFSTSDPWSPWVPMGCYSYGVSRIPAGQATSYINLIPVFTLAMGMAILDEALNVQQTIACALVFGGIFLSQHRAHRRVPVRGEV